MQTVPDNYTYGVRDSQRFKMLDNGWMIDIVTHIFSFYHINKAICQYDRKDKIQMKILDLFCGTKSIANAFEKRGHEVYTVDWDKSFNPILSVDIGTLTAEDIIALCGEFLMLFG